MKKRTILKATVGMSLVLCQILYAGEEGSFNTYYGFTAGINLPKDAEIENMKVTQKLQAEKIAKIESLLTNLALKTPHKDKDQLSVNFK